jgi:hypothetical protein
MKRKKTEIKRGQLLCSVSREENGVRLDLIGRKTILIPFGAVKVLTAQINHASQSMR